jgi:c-di-GMP phosphodiesterase
MSAQAGEADASSRFVARQPIFDGRRKLVGYELLYRAHLGASTAAGGFSGAQMSASTLVHGLLDIGLEALVGNVPAWVNCPRDMLVSGALEVLPTKGVVLEVLETVEPDAEVIAAVQSLAARGYTIALDDFVGGEDWEPLLKVAKIVKFDVLPFNAATLRPQLQRMRKYNVKILAERIEDQDVFNECTRMGFDFFQGYYFRKPEVVHRKTLPIAMARIAKLMTLVGNPRVGDHEIEAELRGDPGLSVKFLRIVNNASSGYTNVSSLRHAIQLAGRRTLHHWLAMLFVASVPVSSGVEHEGVLVALERGRFCELMALGQGKREQADPLFLVGLLARIDELLGLPMEEIVKQLGVTPDVGAALLGEPGPHTPFLTLAQAYEGGEWDRVATVANPLGMEHTLPVLYGEAGGWARKVLTAA